MGEINRDGFSALGLKYYQTSIFELSYGTDSALFPTAVGEKVLMPAMERMLTLGFRMCGDNSDAPAKFVYVTNEEFMQQAVQAEQKSDAAKAYESYPDFCSNMQPIPTRTLWQRYFSCI